MALINNKTEKEFRDQQDAFGHIHASSNLSTWLSDVYREGSIKERRYHKVIRDFLGSSDAPLDVLEVAAGTGDFIMFCSKLFPQHRYVANDLSKKLLKNNIKTVANYFNILPLSMLSFCPVEKLTQPENSFDIVFVKAAVHHFEDPVRGLEEIYRVLRPGGRLVFIEDPICIDVPLYRNWKKKNFSLAERSIGINEHIYTVADYFSFGKIFSKRGMYVDRELLKEYDIQQQKRTGIKKFTGYILQINRFIFRQFMMWRFSSPIIFEFRK